jgi:hypothetical protein
MRDNPTTTQTTNTGNEKQQPNLPQLLHPWPNSNNTKTNKNKQKKSTQLPLRGPEPQVRQAARPRQPVDGRLGMQNLREFFFFFFFLVKIEAMAAVGYNRHQSVSSVETREQIFPKQSNTVQFNSIQFNSIHINRIHSTNQSEKIMQSRQRQAFK